MYDERQEIMKTSPRTKARPASKSVPVAKSKRPMPAEPARTNFMLKRQARVGDGYAKGGTVKKKK
jgi:hypothetical protein